jgi:hypothetical protein
MIKGLMGTKGVVVSGGNTSVPYVNMAAGSMGNPMQGMLRIHGSDMQVFDGSSWQNISTSYATVELDQDTQDLLQWARTQRTLEMNRKFLIENNPALEKAYEAVKRAEENFDILSKFVEHDEPGIVVGYNFGGATTP